MMKATSPEPHGTGRLAPLVCALGLVLVFLCRGAALDAGHAQHAEMPPPIAPEVLQAQAPSAAPTRGAAVYGEYCASCHQATGQGVPGAFPPLANVKLIQGDARYLARVVLFGLQGQVTVNGQTFNGASPAFATSLSDDQISQALTYIRAAWGNNAAAVGAAVVQAERAKPGTPQDNYEKYPK